MARYTVGVVSDQVFVLLDRLIRGAATTAELHDRWQYVFGSRCEPDSLVRLLSRQSRLGYFTTVPVPGACTLHGEPRVVYSITPKGRAAWEFRRDVLARALGVAGEPLAAAG
jgi:DNA-binding PadR family transcriptional regulator